MILPSELHPSTSDPNHDRLIAQASKKVHPRILITNHIHPALVLPGHRSDRLLHIGPKIVDRHGDRNVEGTVTIGDTLPLLGFLGRTMSCRA